jgi:hypothetical protein
MTRIRRVQYNQLPHQASENPSGCRPIQFRNGLATKTAVDPVTEKTMRIIISWKFDEMPQRSFSFFMG